MNIGDRISVNGENGTISEIYGADFVVRMDGGTTWYSPPFFKPEIKTSPVSSAVDQHLIALPPVSEEEMPAKAEVFSAGTKRIRARLSDPLPCAVSSLFRDHLQKQYKLRLLYRAEAEPSVRAWFFENDLDLDRIAPGIIPVKSKMQSVAGTLTFPAPDDASFLPPSFHYISRGKNTEVNDVRLVVALVKLGFQINDYAGRKAYLAAQAG